MAEITSIDIPPDPEKPVTLVVDTSNAEDGGELDVVVQQSDFDLKDPDLQVLEVQEKKYSVVFKPPKSGLYSVMIKYKDQNVSGSPLQLNLSLPNAKQVNLTKPPTGKIRAGQSIEIWFDSFLAGRGTFTATCKGGEVGEIPVDITRQDITSTHKVTFLPPQEDEYNLSVSYSGVPVKGSPYKIDLIPVRASLVKCSEPMFPEGKSGPVEMDVCTEGSGNAQLTATCGGSGNDNIPISIDEVSKNNYHLKLEPTKDDMLTLTVKYGGKDVPGSPFLINVTKSEPSSVEEPVEAVVSSKEQDLFSAAPDKVKFGDLHVPEVFGANSKVWINADCSEAGQGTLTAECIGQNEEGSIHVSVEKIEPDGNYQIKFIPEVPDIYTLTIFFGDKLVPGGTFEINLLPKSNAKLVHHLGTFIPDDIGEPVVLKFDASKAGQGTMRGRVNGVSQAGLVVSRVDLIDEENKIYHLLFIPDGADTYNVDMYWCDESIPGSPIYVKIIYPAQVTLSDPVNPQVYHPVTVSANTREAGPGDLTASCSGRDSGPIDTEIIQDGDTPTEYNVYFHPIVADLYVLRVYFSGIEVKQSPIQVDIQPIPPSLPPQPSPTLLEPEPVTEYNNVVPQKEVWKTYDLGGKSSDVEDTSNKKPDLVVPTKLEMFIGQPLTLLIEDIEGEIDDLKASASGEKTGETSIVTSPTENKGSYRVEFQPTEPDTYTIDILLFNSHIPGSPYIIEYREEPVQIKSPDFEHEVIPGHPIIKPYLIQYLYQQDDMKDVLAYALHDDTCTRHILRTRKENDGKTLLVFYPQKTGLHFIHIKQGQKEIRGSPFKVEIVDSSASACTIIDVPEKSYLDEIVAVQIDASKAGAGDLNILATVPTGGKGTIFNHSDNDCGIYTIRFTPKVVGRHKIDVKWAGVTVHNSPIIIDVLQLTDEVRQARDAASRVTVLEEGKDTFRAKLLHSNGAQFYVKTDKAGQGQLTLKSQGPANSKINIYKQNSGLYECKVKPIVSGKYDITILWNDIPIPNNPFQLDFTADKTYIINNLDLESKHFILHQPCEFRVNCGENEGTLQVMASPMESAIVDVSLLKDNIYLVKIIPQVQGNHELSLKFAGRHVLLSPYHVQFEAPNKPMVDGKIQRLSSLNFPICSTSPDVTDDTMAIISDSDTIKVKANGPGLQEGIIGQEGNFTIDTTSVGEGKLEISIEGSKGTFKTRLRRHPDDDRILLGRYDPTHIGEYTINILWCERHVEGSPFVVSIKAQEQNSG